jgi:hypothetical protein
MSCVAATNGVRPSATSSCRGAVGETELGDEVLEVGPGYGATGLVNTHRDFTVGPKGSTSLKFNGLNTGSSYHVVIVCNDSSGKQAEPIGRVEQDVTI